MNLLEFDTHHVLHQEATGQVVRDYLTSNGWKYTSRHPGSLWLWTFDKTTVVSPGEDGEPAEVNTLTYAVQESVALQIQRYWELEAQQFPAHADDCLIFQTWDWETCSCGVFEG